MAARHICFIALGLSLSSFGFAAPVPDPVEGEDAQPHVENAKFQAFGRITRSAEARSGPGDTYYPTAKISKDAKVKVVGVKGDWLKIEPPADSFSYIPAAYVTRRGNGSVGRVNSKAYIRAGSTLNSMKTIVQAELHEGDDVEIIAPQDEYFKIVPPKGAYVYVNQKFVEPLGPVNPPIASNQKKPAVGDENNGVKPADGDAGNEKIVETETPTTEPGTKLVERTPTTGPAVADASETFAKLEAEFEEASKLDMAEQPIEKLTDGYKTLAKSGAMTGTNKKIIEARLVALKLRADAREQLVGFRQSRDLAQAKLRDLVEEKKELDARAKKTEVTLYTAVGTMRMSSLQQGSATLYRLTDPTNGRTVVYIRSNDPKYASLLNQFVGVRGDLTSDQSLRMKIITPTEAEKVDAAKVNRGVIATITPPGMMLSSSAAADQSDAGN